MPKIEPIVAANPEELAEALGLDVAEAREWKVQHALLRRLRAIVQRKALTHAKIASLADTSRTRVTAILNDDLRHVSTDLLIRILGSLGYEVQVSVVREGSARNGISKARPRRLAARRRRVIA